MEIKLVNIYESTWKVIKHLINRKFIIVVLKITPNFDHKKWFWINQPRVDKPLFCYRPSAITSAGCGLVQHWIWQAWGMNDVKCTPSEHCHLHTILSLPWMWHRQMPSHLFTTTFFFYFPKVKTIGILFFTCYKLLCLLEPCSSPSDREILPYLNDSKLASNPMIVALLKYYHYIHFYKLKSLKD